MRKTTDIPSESIKETAKRLKNIENEETKDTQWLDKWLQAKMLFDLKEEDKAIALVKKMTKAEMLKKCVGFKPEDVDDILSIAYTEIWMHFAEFKPYFVAINDKKNRSVKVSRAHALNLINAEEKRYLLLIEEKINSNLGDVDKIMEEAIIALPNLRLSLGRQTGISFCLNKLAKAKSEIDAQVKNVSRSVRDRQNLIKKGLVAAKKQSTVDKLKLSMQFKESIPIHTYTEDAGVDSFQGERVFQKTPKQLQTRSAEDDFLQSIEDDKCADVETVLELSSAIAEGNGALATMPKYQRVKVKKIFLAEMYKFMGLEISLSDVVNDEKKLKIAEDLRLVERPDSDPEITSEATSEEAPKTKITIDITLS